MRLKSVVLVCEQTKRLCFSLVTKRSSCITSKLAGTSRGRHVRDTTLLACEHFLLIKRHYFVITATRQNVRFVSDMASRRSRLDSILMGRVSVLSTSFRNVATICASYVYKY